MALVALALRWPALAYRGFVNHDVGGILYESMLLRAGGLPYVDALEMKAPLAFFLAAAGLAGPSGRDVAAFQLAETAVAVVAYLLGAPVLDSMDANYVTWALPPAFGAAVASARAAEAGSGRAFGLAGALAVLAGLARRQAACVALAVVWAVLRRPERRGPAAAAAAVGALLALVPFWLPYAASGHGRAFFEGVFANPWGVAYVGRIPFSAVEAVRATAFFLAWPLAVALVGIGAGRGCAAPRAGGRTAEAMAVFAAAAIPAAWVGGRFYKGYWLIAYLPACYLAGAAWARIFGAGTVRLRRTVAVAVFVALGLRQAAAWLQVARERRIVRDRPQRRLSAFVERTTRPDDRIWCWGWHLWGIYALAGRLSASRIYKGLGLLTEPNDDTWRKPQGRLRFRDGPAARALLEDFARTPPAVVLLGGTVPRTEFAALRSFLREGYRLDRTVRVGRVEVWVRRGDHRSGAP